MKRRDLVKSAVAIAAIPRFAPPAPEWQSWRADGARVNGWLTELSRFGANPGGGVSRTGFSDADVAGRAWIRPLMEAAGLEVSIDPAGNMLGRRPGTVPSLRPLLFGSHIDSVPNGGNYDGDVGTLGAIEVARLLAEKKYRNRHPLWVTLWCDEERGLTGSRGFIGRLGAAELKEPITPGGPPLGELIRKVGGDPAALPGYRHEPGSIAGYVELHIEQGGTLDEAGLRIGVVEGIVGIRRWDVTISGFANHAGTTPMDRRRNALLAGSELVVAVDRIVRASPGRQVGTVGRLGVKPGAPNVIPGEVTLTIEIRDLSMEKLETLWREIEAEATAIMTRRGTTWTAVPQAPNEAALSDPAVRKVIDQAARSLELSTRQLPSGAGHDAQSLARIGPMGMIFVPSVGGISHSPKEFTKAEDVSNGVNVLLQTILRLDQEAGAS